MRTEWAGIGRDEVVVATEERAWIHRIAVPTTSDPFAAPMTGTGAPKTTGRLLDGALGAAQRELRRDAGSALTLTGYAWRLVGHYHTTRATCIFMRHLARRFEELGRPDLVAFALETIQGESGHDRLALRDLRALGFPAEEIVAALTPPRAAALVELFREYTYGEEPVAAFGYGYALERSCIAITREYVESIERLLPAGVRATRCLRVHSSLGAEVAHVADSVRTIAALPAVDRTRIARAVYETARLMFAPLGPGELAGAPLAAFLRGHAPGFESMALSKDALAGAGAAS